ncbi:MAG TPA: serine hydrolase domain-containing protein [Pirellulaceae bacterium]|jgi:CubicO group peptidase (beta-lactamase class C family)
MDRRNFMRVAGVVGVSFAGRVRGQTGAVIVLSERLAAIRQQYGFPGIAAAAVRGNVVVAEGVAGVRRVGGDEKIEVEDRFAIASCTKKMTAAMIARVIDAGKLSFETTLAEALPDVPMRDDYRGVTVTQLLQFSGGIQPYLQFGPEQAALLQGFKGTDIEKRGQFVKHVLQEEPVVKPGTERRYSNASYAVVAFVAEQRTGKTWEELMRGEVFQPLGMSAAGFGRPRSKDRPDEPTLHRKTDTGFEPEPDERVNVMAVFAPAGDVHCSIRDFAKFASYELNAANDNNSLLKPATAKQVREMSQTAGPLMYPKMMKKKGGDGKEGGDKIGAKKGPPPGRPGNSFFGGSDYVSAGCILWPEENLAAVAAINAGASNEAVRTAHEVIKQAVGG